MISRRPRIAPIGLAALAFVAGACSHDWDPLDPRLGTASVTTGTGGATSASSAGGEGGAAPLCTPGATSPCYTGPPGTEGVGVCAGGSALCDDDGLALGPCVGEVTPAAEVCPAPADEDCDGQVNEAGDGCSCTPNLATDCYDGPPGTEDVGACAGGQKICDAMGRSYGPCLSQVLPIVEECTSAADDDCDGAANDHCGVWAEGFGDGNEQHGLAINVDLDDHVIVAGHASGSIDFGGGALPGAATDVVVAKLAPTGAFVWAKRFGDGAAQIGRGVSTDPAGAVYVTGSFAGTISFDGGATTLTSAGLDDIFVAKLSKDGAHLWSKRFGGAGADAGRSIAAGGAGGVMVAGDFSASVDFGAGAKTAVELLDGFVVALDFTTGAHVWSKVFGGTGNDAALAVDADATHVFLAGAFDEVVDLGGGPLTDLGSNDAFAAKLTSAGTHVWSKRFGPASDQSAQSIDVDKSGNVLLTGRYASSINLGGQDLPSAGGTDIFVARLDPDGNHLWSKGHGGPADDFGVGVKGDGDGNVISTANFSGTIDLGAGPMTAPGVASDVLVAKWSPAGALLWARRFGDGGDDDVRGIDLDAAGNILLTGESDGKLDFGSGNLPDAGSNDLFVAKLAQ